MPYYGDNATIRKDFLSGGVDEGHPQFQTEGLVADALITNGRRYAFETINRILRGRFAGSIPFTSGSEEQIIKEYSNIIAAWWIQNQRLQHLINVSENPLNTLYAETIEQLKEIATTGIGLAETTSGKAAAFHTHANRTPTFDIDDEFDQIPDQDRLDDIADARL
jgi:hypothetical protein